MSLTFYVPRYPRIPHLLEGPGRSSDDVVLTEAERRQFLTESVVVEEKLDGANVWVQVDELGRPEIGGRSGGRSDRGRQLGRLRAWVAERVTALAANLEPGTVLFGEWLYLTHSIHYDRLPDLLVLVDLMLPDGTFVDRCLRESYCRKMALVAAPLVFEGRLGSVDAVAALHGPSAFAEGPAEGLILRREAGGSVLARAKWVHPRFRPKPDKEWHTERRYNNLS